MAFNMKTLNVLIFATILTTTVIEAGLIDTIAKLQDKINILTNPVTTSNKVIVTTADPTDNDYDDNVQGLAASMLTGDPYADYFANMTYSMIMQYYKCTKGNTKKIQKSLNAMYTGISTCTTTAVNTATTINFANIIANLVTTINGISTQITTCATSFMTSVSGAISCIINLTGSIIGAVTPGGVAAYNYANCVAATVVPNQNDVNAVVAKCKKI